MNDQKAFSPNPPNPYVNSFPPSYSGQKMNSGGNEYSFDSPRNNNKSEENTEMMFKSTSWRDLWAAVLFYLHFIGVFAIVGLNFNYIIKFFEKINESEIINHVVNPDDSNRSKELVNQLLKSLSAVGISLVITLICLAVFLSLISRFPKTMIKGTFISTIVLLGLFSLIGFVNLSVGASVLFLASAIFNIVLYFMWRSRIPFSAVLLKTVVDVINLYPNLWNLSVMAVVAQTIFIFLFCFASFSISIKYEFDGVSNVVSDNIKILDLVSVFYLVFSFYWSSQVVDNVVHTSICGVFGTFYFIYGTGAAIVNPVWNSFKRSMTYSFGSIAFGSLIVAILQLVRFMLKSIHRDRNNAAAALADCLLGLIENLVCYFNYYAYVHVAIYGKPYIQSAMDTWELVKSNGVDVIINDSLIGKCLGVGIFIISIISMLSALVISKNLFKLEEFSFILSSSLAFIFSLIICSVATQLIGSGTSAILVCYAEDPLALQRSNPELYDEIKSAYRSSSI